MRMPWPPSPSTSRWRERQEADRLQAVLSSVKIFLALLPDDTRLELRAPKPNTEAPADRLGVRRASRPERCAASVGGARCQAFRGK
jgi:hypothetical protein